MLDKLKKNWLNILIAILGLLAGADAAVGVRSGKSPVDVTVVGSLLAAIGSSGVLGLRWLNNRTVTTKATRVGLESSLIDRLENLYSLARDPDVTSEQAEYLSGIAGGILMAEYRRAKKIVVVESASNAVDQLHLEKIINILAPKSDKPKSEPTTIQETAR